MTWPEAGTRRGEMMHWPCLASAVTAFVGENVVCISTNEPAPRSWSPYDKESGLRCFLIGWCVRFSLASPFGGGAPVGTLGRRGCVQAKHALSVSLCSTAPPEWEPRRTFARAVGRGILDAPPVFHPHPSWGRQSRPRRFRHRRSFRHPPTSCRPVAATFMRMRSFRADEQ